ncbi:MAG: hypothetical protein OXE98_02845 [Hyphomicrobiales bacterium]|nr:hypothetical protein [Hyphomicrobiales bacterium]
MDYQKESVAKGFAGIKLLVSKIDKELLSLEDSREKQSLEKKPGTGNVEPSHPSPKAKEGNSSTVMWFAGTAFIAFILWANYSSNEQSTTSAGYQAQSQGSKYEGFLPLRPIDKRPPKPSQESKLGVLWQNIRPTEERPPVGKNNLLSMAELHYCLAEEIRLEGARAYLDIYGYSGEVGRFIWMVDDYNNRCASFQYRAGDLERAQHAVEVFKSDILTEGRARF